MSLATSMLTFPAPSIHAGSSVWPNIESTGISTMGLTFGIGGHCAPLFSRNFVLLCWLGVKDLNTSLRQVRFSGWQA